MPTPTSSVEAEESAPEDRPDEPSPHVPTPTSSVEAEESAAEDADEPSPHVPTPTSDVEAEERDPEVPTPSAEKEDSDSGQGDPAEELPPVPSPDIDGEPLSNCSEPPPHSSHAKAGAACENGPASGVSEESSGSDSSSSSMSMSEEDDKEDEVPETPLRDPESYRPKNDAKLAKAARALRSPLTKRSPPAASSWQKDYTPPKTRVKSKMPNPKSTRADATGGNLATICEICMTLSWYGVNC